MPRCLQAFRKTLLPVGTGVFLLTGTLCVSALERLEPIDGCLWGVSLDRAIDTVGTFTERVGFSAADYVAFVDFPLTPASRSTLQAWVNEVKPTGAILLVTLEPWQGLSVITDADCAALAELCATYEQQHVKLMLRFAHEMNGSWYPWGQSPQLYIEKFRQVALKVHALTTQTAMLWAPNYGGGYPYSGGAYEAKRGSPEFLVLDTNHDGVLNMADDMYGVYYPGDDVVDWVGLTIYHWGLKYPWGENEMPEARNFVQQITGTYNGANGDDRMVPDFYQVYCAGKHKPMAVPETAAMYNTGHHDGAPELDLKQAWWRQVFDITGDRPDALDLAQHFPGIKIINWFDVRKVEGEAQGNVVDWSVTHNATIRIPFLSDLRQLRNGSHYFLSAEETLDREATNLRIQQEANGQVLLRIPTSTNRTYRIYTTDDPARTWDAVAGDITGTGSEVQWTDSATSPSPEQPLVSSRFYKVRIAR